MITTRDAFERGTRTFNDHDLAGFAEVLDDDVVFDAPGGMNGRGKEACAAFFAGWWSAFSDGRVGVHDVQFVDDYAVEEGTFTGTHDGVLATPAGDIPPTHQTVHIPYIQVLRFRDGKHRSFHLAFDRLELLEQLGLAGAPAPTG
jgi:steroid delta-isomerase-like uncharacterized protein